MTRMTEEWVLLWYQCLYRNFDYEKHCQLSDGLDDIDLPNWNQARYEQLDELYKDFGTLNETVNVDINGEAWKQWFEPRRHLFIPLIKSIDVFSNAVAREGCITLEIPLHLHLQDTQKLVMDYLEKYYENNQFIKFEPPKYKLHTVKGRVAHGYEQVRQAVITSKEYSDEGDLLKSIAPTVKGNMIKFLQREIDNLGWTLDPKAKDDLMNKGLMDQERLEVFKARINRCRREFLALSKNASRGRFPDMSEFESDSFDVIGFAYKLQDMS